MVKCLGGAVSFFSQNVLAAGNFPIYRKSFAACFTLECSLSQQDPFLAAYFFCCLQLQIIMTGLNINFVLISIPFNAKYFFITHGCSTGTWSL